MSKDSGVVGSTKAEFIEKGKSLHEKKLESEMKPIDLRLIFVGKTPYRVYTGVPIQIECPNLHVALVADLTGTPIKNDQIASAKVELVLVDSNFEGNTRGSWTCEEFNSKVVYEEEGKKLLQGTGNYCVVLVEGMAAVGNLCFKHARSHFKKQKFRLAARAVGYYEGIRVIEAITEPFSVMDRRGMSKMDRLLSPTDDVWRLVKIQRNGPFHRSLTEAHIYTVEDFFTEFSVNPERLREILGKHMNSEMLDKAVDHAQMCKHDMKSYKYTPTSDQLLTVVFNVARQIKGLVCQELFTPYEMLSDSFKEIAANLVASAFNHWGEVKTYENDHAALLSSSQTSPATVYNTQLTCRGDGSGGSSGTLSSSQVAKTNQKAESISFVAANLDLYSVQNANLGGSNSEQLLYCGNRDQSCALHPGALGQDSGSRFEQYFDMLLGDGQEPTPRPREARQRLMRADSMRRSFSERKAQENSSSEEII